VGIPTFDIEAINWTKPIAIGFYDGAEYHEFIREDLEDDVIWRFLEHLRDYHKGIKIYGHYSSKYDNKIILSCLCKHEEEIALEAGLNKLKWVLPEISFEDSYLLAPMSLKKLTKMFAVEEKGEWNHNKNLAPWEMGDQLATFKQYLKTDCLSLSAALTNLCECLGSTFGVMPSISLSTTSVKAYDKIFYDLSQVEENEPFEVFIRAATYGGRNEVYKRYGENIRHYDVKSMYVSCYDTPVPTGKLKWARPGSDIGGLAEAKVKIPKDLYIGPLPVRIGDRLCFPTGEINTPNWWDTRELLYAAENFGVDITITRQLAAREEPILESFGRFVSALRGTKQDEYWKMFGLAVSGKFGQSRWRDVIKHWSEIQDFSFWSPLNKEEIYFIGKEYLKKSPYIRTAIAMRIRAEARIRHLKIIKEAYGKGDIFYGDTDSIFTTAEMPSSDKVGDLTYVGLAERGYFIKQKLYALVEEGILRQKSAGYSDLSLQEEDFKKLLEGQDIEVESGTLTSFRNILNSKEVTLLNGWRKLKGTSSDNRVPLGNDTRPLILPQEAERMIRAQ